jgi:hypothetical protein
VKKEKWAIVRKETYDYGDIAIDLWVQIPLPAPRRCIWFSSLNFGSKKITKSFVFLFSRELLY